MTEQHDQITSTPDERRSALPEPPVYDMMLAEIIDAVNSSPDNAVGVTVSIPGSIVSGVLIPRDVWIERQAAVGKPKGLDQLWPEYTMAKLEERNPDYLEWFLHLEDAAHVGGHVVPSNGGVLMRIRLNDVTSWALTYIAAAAGRPSRDSEDGE